MNATRLDALLAGAAFSDLDRHFARLMQRLAGEAGSPELELAAALLSRAKGEGDVCLDLARLAGTDWPENATPAVPAVRCPALADWLARLGAASVVGRPGAFAPLILAEPARLYLHRYWQYEQELATAILAHATAPPGTLNRDVLQAGLARLFPSAMRGETDWQQVAALVAVRKRFCVISGGPGTGKTRTVVLLLALLLEQAAGRPLHIALAAPTGKAAARLQESIRSARAALDCAAEIKAALPEAASTLHRLLGYRPGSPDFRHNAAQPLPADVVVVDEASMVDLALMAKLFAALRPDAHVILLGDRDQLASVEAGAVLGDICGAARANEFSTALRADYAALTGGTLPGADVAEPSPLADCVVQLQKNYRFGAANGIQALSHAVNTGDADSALALLREGTREGVAMVALPVAAQMKAALRERVLAALRPGLQAPDAATALAALNRFRILCALRQGPFGVEQINERVEEILAEAGWVERGGPWFRGRPVMVTQNDYDLGLFNGDVGVVWPDASGAARVWFAGEDGALRAVLPVRLPPHETVFAMTVHKSQGSEFAEILLVLPDRETPVLTRELIYTGLTRASGRAELWLAEPAFRAGVARTVTRASGLRAALGAGGAGTG